jgi:hypothetical protein
MRSICVTYFSVNRAPVCRTFASSTVHTQTQREVAIQIRTKYIVTGFASCGLHAGNDSL